jgi:hypothetical protein
MPTARACALLGIRFTKEGNCFTQVSDAVGLAKIADSEDEDQSTPSGLRAMLALVALRKKVIKPLLAAAQGPRKSRGAQNPKA